MIDYTGRPTHSGNELPVPPPRRPAAPAAPPDPLGRLYREGWPAVDKPLADFAAGKITYERALAETLMAVAADWTAFWWHLRAAVPFVSDRLAKELAAGRRVTIVPPLVPLNTDRR